MRLTWLVGIRRSLLGFLLFLAVFFNLERLDVGDEALVNIHSFVYVLMVVVALFVLFVPLASRLSIYLLQFGTLGIYVVLRLTVFNRQPLFDDAFTYVTTSEVALLALGVFLTDALAQDMRKMEKAIENVTLVDEGRNVVSLEDAREQIKTEMLRSRRHQREVSLLLFEQASGFDGFEVEQTIQQIQRAMLARYVSSSLAQLVRLTARRSDMVIAHPDTRRLILLAPETDTAGGEVVAERVQRLADERLGMRFRASIVTFPEDALTFDDLLEQAELKLAAQGDNLLIDSSMAGEDRLSSEIEGQESQSPALRSADAHDG